MGHDRVVNTALPRDLGLTYDRADQLPATTSLVIFGRMCLLCYSPEGHKLLLNTRNNSDLLATEIDKLHDRL